MNAQDLKELLDNGGTAECSVWLIHKVNNKYCTDCWCHPTNEFDTAEELFDALPFAIDTATDKDGNKLL